MGNGDFRIWIDADYWKLLVICRSNYIYELMSLLKASNIFFTLGTVHEKCSIKLATLRL